MDKLTAHNSLIKGIVNSDPKFKITGNVEEIENLTQYLQYCLVTFNLKNREALNELHTNLGIRTEASELLSQLKAVIAYNRDLTIPQHLTNIIEELGDLLFFCTVHFSASGLGYGSLYDVFSNPNFFEDMEKHSLREVSFRAKNSFLFDFSEDFVVFPEGPLTPTEKVIIVFVNHIAQLESKFINSKGADNKKIGFRIFLDYYAFFKGVLNILPDDITIKEIAKKNIKKLKARYPDGFNNISANNRDKEKEMVEMMK